MIPTTEEIIHRLRNEPMFLSDVIVYNNPGAVNEKLNRHSDYVAETPEQLADYVRGLIANNQFTIVNDILQVPFKSEDASPQLVDAYKQMVNERGTTVEGKFLDTSGGLLLLASQTETPEEKPAVAIVNPNSKNGCGCGGKCQGKFKTLVITKKHLIIGAIIIGLVIYWAYNHKK